ncbi:MAG: Ig-like domain-containing protein [Litorilinea sp.]
MIFTVAGLRLNFDRLNFDRVVWLIVGLLGVTITLVALFSEPPAVRVAAVLPHADAEAVSTRAAIVVGFDQPVTVPPDSVLVRLDPPVNGTLRVAEDRVTFVPAQGLTPNTTYTVTVDGALRGPQGGGLAAPYVWHFATGDLQVLFSSLDADNREQLSVVPVTLDGFAPAANTPTDALLPESRRLTGAPFGIWDFGVDAASGRIVFSQLSETATSDLWLLEPGAPQPELLLSCPEAACGGAVFSPDGRFLAYSQRNASEFGVPVISPPRLRLMDMATRETYPIFSDSQQLAFEPRWSGDSQWLSFIAPDSNAIGIFNVEDGRSEFYPSTTGEAASWQPNSNRFVMSEMLLTTGEAGDQYEVHMYLVDAVTGAYTDLSVHEFPVEDNGPAWSPDGEWLAFRRKELAGPRESLSKQLWRMRADGSAAEPLTIAPDFDYGPPQWSPDGRYLLYHKYPLRGPDIEISTWILDVETGTEHPIARPAQRPVWVP